MKHIILTLRLVPVVLSLWWADVRDPGSALRILRAVAAVDAHRLPVVRAHILAGVVASWAVAAVACFWAGFSLAGAAVCAVAGTYSAVALSLHDRLEAL